MEYLEERYPEPSFLPSDPAERALARLIVWQFDDRLGRDYYAVRRGDSDGGERLAVRLADLDRILSGQRFLSGSSYGLADIAYFPWLPRAQTFGADLGAYPAIEQWMERLSDRPAIAAEIDVFAALPR